MSKKATTETDYVADMRQRLKALEDEKNRLYEQVRQQRKAQKEADNATIFAQWKIFVKRNMPEVGAVMSEYAQTFSKDHWAEADEHAWGSCLDNGRHNTLLHIGFGDSSISLNSSNMNNHMTGGGRGNGTVEISISGKKARLRNRPGIACRRKTWSRAAVARLSST